MAVKQMEAPSRMKISSFIVHIIFHRDIRFQAGLEDKSFITNSIINFADSKSTAFSSNRMEAHSGLQLMDRRREIGLRLPS